MSANQPGNNDAVLGGGVPPLIDGAVVSNGHRDGIKVWGVK